jgi:hypothetical protein
VDRGTVQVLAGSGAAEAALPPVPARAGSTPPPPTPPAPLGDGQRSESNAEFLARQAASEATAGQLKQTFARFVVNHETHEVSVEIVDAANNQVVRSIPNDELRRMAQRYSATHGVLLDSAV